MKSSERFRTSRNDKKDMRDLYEDIAGKIPDKPGNDEKGRLNPLAFLLLLLLFVFSGCEKKSPTQKAPEEAKPVAIKPEETKPREINLKETRLAAIPEDYDRWGNIVFSANGQKVFYIGNKGGKKFVVIGSPSGERSGNAYEDVTFMVVSPDGQRVAFGGKRGKKKYLVVDNKELKALYHEEVAPGAFSPDSRLVACEVGGLKEKKWFVVVSDGEKEVYRSRIYPDTFRRPVFSPDSRLLVYELGDDKAKIKNKKRTVFFLDLVTKKIIKERLYTDCQAGSFSFSSDSSRVIYNVQKEGKNFLVLQDFALDEEREIDLPYASVGQFALSPDGKHIIYTATKEGKHYLVVSPWESSAQGKESGPYEGIVPAIFSPDSRIVAYRAMKEGKWRIVVGDKEGRGYDGVGDAPVFSPDGAKIAYPAMKNGKWFMAVSLSDKPKKVSEGPVYDMVVTPVFSPDGRHLAYRARNGPMEKARRFIVIADAETGKVIKEGPVSDEVWPPVWSTDGKSAAYGTRIGRELWWKVESVK